MGRIVGSPGNIFGRRRTKITGIGPIQKRDKLKDAVNTLGAISGGLKVFEQAANLGTLIGGGIDRAVRNKKRDAARKALEQDRATQQKQVDTAVSEAGQALESMPRLQEPDTSPGGAVDAGTQQFLQSIGLSGPTLGQSLSGSLMPARALVSEEDAAARLAGLRDRSGPSSVIADMGKMSPEEAYAASELNEAQLRAQADRLELIRARQRATAPEDALGEVGLTQDVVRSAGDRRVRAGLTPEQIQRANAIVNAYGRMSPAQQMMVPPVGAPGEIEKPIGQRIMTQGGLAQEAMELDVARLSMPPTMSQDVAMTVSPELTRPIVTPPTTDLSRLEDLDPLSNRALATYDPGQLMAAAASTRDPAVMERILRAAQGQAQPTNFAELVSGQRQADLDKRILDQFGKFVPKPPSAKDLLELEKLREQITTLRARRADTTGQDLRRAQAEAARALAAKRTQELNKAIARANKRAPRGLSGQAEKDIAQLDRQLEAFLAGKDAPLFKDATTANVSLVYQRQYKGLRRANSEKALDPKRLNDEASKRWGRIRKGVYLKAPATGEEEAKAQEAKQKATSTFKNKIAAGRRALVTAENKFQQARQSISTSTDADDRPKDKEEINAQKRVLAAELNKVVRVYEQAISDGAQFTAEDLADYQAVKTRAISLGE